MLSIGVILGFYILFFILKIVEEDSELKKWKDLPPEGYQKF